jgi:hypothetical protein
MVCRFTAREKQYDAYGQTRCKSLCNLNDAFGEFVTVAVSVTA